MKHLLTLVAMIGTVAQPWRKTGRVMCHGSAPAISRRFRSASQSTPLSPDPILLPALLRNSVITASSGAEANQ